MTVYLSAGVYPKETDFSSYVKSLASSYFGMVGIFEKGKVGEVTTVSSLPDAERKLGDYITQGVGMYTLKAFFDNGGAVAQVVRTAHYTDITDRTTLAALVANATITDGAATPVDILDVEATSEGAWGNAYSVRTTPKTTTFDLEVLKNGTVVRSYKDVSTDVNSDVFVEDKVNGVDPDISVTALVSDGSIPQATTAALSGGDDGLTGLTDTDFVGDEGAKNGLYALTGISNLNTVAIPGKSSATVISAGLAFAESRGDIMFLADTPEALTVQEALDFRNGEGAYTHSAFNSSYGALYYPHIKVTDAKNGRQRLLPPSAFVAGRIVYNDENGGVWKAPAGLSRGVLQNVLGVERTLNQSERDLLYPAQVNPIANFSEDGVVIWGQKTLQTKASATDRINVRRLMIHIEKAIGSLSRYLLFEQNSKTLQNAFVRKVTPFLQRLKDAGAFYDFKVQCDEALNTPQVVDNNQLYARVYVKPSKTAEFFPIDYAIAPTGAEFTELFNAA